MKIGEEKSVSTQYFCEGENVEGLKGRINFDKFKDVEAGEYSFCYLNSTLYKF